MRSNRATTLLLAALLMPALTSCGQSGNDDEAKGTLEWVTGLRAGHCADPAGPATDSSAATITRVRRIPCDQPHSLETYARVPYPVSRTADDDASTSTAEYPGNVVLQVFAREACARRFRSYLGTDLRRPWFFLTYLYPSAASWAAADAEPSRLGPLTHLVGQAPRADRSVVCVVRTTGPALTASVHGPPYPIPKATPKATTKTPKAKAGKQR
jgi:hypothetical protein